MTDPAKPSLFSTNNLNPKIDKSSPSSPLSSPSKDNQMLTSFTVPMTVPGPKIDDPKAGKKESSPSSVMVEGGPDKSRVQVQKTGGTLNVPQQKGNQRTGEQGSQQQGPETRTEQYLVMETLMENLFSLRKIKQNQQVKPNEVISFIEVFKSLTASSEARKTNHRKLSNPEERKKLFQEYKYLKNVNDSKILDQAHKDLYTIIQKLMEKSPYLKVQTCVKLTERYIDLNKKEYYPEGKFLLQRLKEPGTNFQTSPKLQNILQEIETIKEKIFINSENALHLLASKKSNRDRDNCPFLQILLSEKKFLRQLSQSLCNDFLNIVAVENEKYAQGKPITFGFELTVLISCLKTVYDLSPDFFDKGMVLKSIIPAFNNCLQLFEGSNLLSLNNIDSLVLNLLLVAPFALGQKEPNSELSRMLREGRMGERYPFLSLLWNDNLNPGQFAPLDNIEYAVFLQKYIGMKKDFWWSKPQIHAFIFNSICQIFKNTPSNDKLNQQLYPKIYRYMNYIMLSSGEEDNQPYLGVCRLCKLISSVCLGGKGQSLNAERIKKLMKDDSQIMVQLLNQSLQVIKQEGEDNDEINAALEQFSINTEVVYEMFFRLIIYDSRYFESKQDIITQHFDSLEAFYLALFTQHIFKFISDAQFTHLNFLALSQMIATPGHFKVCKDIFTSLSTLTNISIKVENEEGVVLDINELDFAVKEIMKVSTNLTRSFPALTRLLLTILHHNPVFLENAWIKGFTAEIRKLIDSYHPTVLKLYAETLVEVLQYLNYHRTGIKNLQAHFDFRFITLYLCQTLAFQLERQSPKIFNKAMRSRRYEEVKLAVKLIKEMTVLYLKDREGNAEKLPPEVRNLLEMPNKGGNFQLLFDRQATSYSVGLAILLLSRQFSLDSYLRKKLPHFKDQIFVVLTNLNQISSLLRSEMTLRIHNLYSRHAEIELNEGLGLKERVLQQIKLSPSFANLEYLLSEPEYRLYLTKELFEKMQQQQHQKDKSLYEFKAESHFIQTYWKHIAEKQLKINPDEAWNYTDNFFRGFDVDRMNILFQEDPAGEKEVMSNIFKASIWMKKANDKAYLQFLLKYHLLFFQYGPGVNRSYDLNEQDQQLSEQFHEAIIYFFNVKSLVANSLLKELLQSKSLQESLYIFILKLLEERDLMRRRGTETSKQISLEVVLYGVNFLVDIGENNAELTGWLEVILTKLMKSEPLKKNSSTKQILLTLLLHGKLQTKLKYYQLSFSNHHWLLLSNVVESDNRYSQILLMDLESIYSSHPIYFVSTCHYFLNLVKTPSLGQLSQFYHVKMNKKFNDILFALLKRTIRDEQSYPVVWVVEILIEIISNEQITPQKSLELYTSIREFLLHSEVVHKRISTLLHKIAQKAGFNMTKIQGCWKVPEEEPKQTPPISLAEKIELIALLKLLTVLYFNPQHDKVLREQRNLRNFSVLLQREKEIFMSMVTLAPLLVQAIGGKALRAMQTTPILQKLMEIKLDRVCSRNIFQSGLRDVNLTQIHDMWPKDASVLDLLSEVSSYQLVSVCAMWLGETVSSQSGKLAINPEILKYNKLDEYLSTFIDLMSETAQKLQQYLQQEKIIEPVLKEVQTIINASLPLAQEMQFTNCSQLGSRLPLEHAEVKRTLGEIVVILHRVLEFVLGEAKKGALRVKCTAKFHSKERNLMSVRPELKNIDEGFPEVGRTTVNNNQSYYSQNLTRTFL